MEGCVVLSSYYFTHRGNEIDLDLSTEEYEKLKMTNKPKMELISTSAGLIGHVIKLAIRPYKQSFRQTRHTLIIQFFEYPKFCCGFVDHKDHDLQVWRNL